MNMKLTGKSLGRGNVRRGYDVTVNLYYIFFTPFRMSHNIRLVENVYSLFESPNSENTGPIELISCGDS